MDNGYLQLDHVRIPRNHMLMKYAQVSKLLDTAQDILVNCCILRWHQMDRIRNLRLIRSPTAQWSR